MLIQPEPLTALCESPDCDRESRLLLNGRKVCTSHFQEWHRLDALRMATEKPTRAMNDYWLGESED